MMPPDDTYLFVIFFSGVLVGMAGMYLIACGNKTQERSKVRHNDHDPADWWKRGENPPWDYGED